MSEIDYELGYKEAKDYMISLIDSIRETRRNTFVLFGIMLSVLLWCGNDALSNTYSFNSKTTIFFITVTCFIVSLFVGWKAIKTSKKVLVGFNPSLLEPIITNDNWDNYKAMFQQTKNSVNNNKKILKDVSESFKSVSIVVLFWFLTCLIVALV